MDRTKLIASILIVVLLISGAALLLFSFSSFFKNYGGVIFGNGNSFPSATGTVSGFPSASSAGNSNNNSTDNGNSSTLNQFVPQNNTNTNSNSGSNSGNNGSGHFQIPPIDVGNVNNSDSNTDNTSVPPVDPRYSSLKGKISIVSVSGGYSDNVVDEYVEIRASSDNAGKILISGLKLQSEPTGMSVAIGNGVPLFYTKDRNYNQSVYLEPGESAKIFTINSPVSYSFRVNKCMGYLANINSLSSFNGYNCPLIKDESQPKAPNQLNDKCLDYLDSFQSCALPPSLSIGATDNGGGDLGGNNTTDNTQDPFFNLSRECQNFVINTADYTSCINNHKSDTDFYGEGWMMFLNHSNRLWKSSREKIQLLDDRGKIVDEYTIN